MLDEQIAYAELGEEARKFLESDLCKVLSGMASQEVTETLLKLADIDPTQTVEVIRFQERIRLFRKFPEWLNELVVKGDQALLSWSQQRRES